MGQNPGVIGAGGRERHRDLGIENLLILNAGDLLHRRQNLGLKLTGKKAGFLPGHHAQRGMVGKEDGQSE